MWAYIFVPRLLSLRILIQGASSPVAGYKPVGLAIQQASSFKAGGRTYELIFSDGRTQE